MLTRIQASGREYQLEYVFDADLPAIPNSILFGELADDLQINVSASIPESARNHWSIKDVDLFKVLLKRGIGRPLLQPKVFRFSEEPIDPQLVAVMMPFRAEFKAVFNALKKVISEMGLQCKRADSIWENDHVVQDVALLLSRASIVVCDLSERNANVFYETGIAHALGRDVILIAQSARDVPFDVAAIRHIKYLPNREGLTKLRAELKARIETLRSRPR